MGSEKKVKRSAGPEDRFYFFVCKVSNVCFEYLTKLTLVGVLNQLAAKIENTTIKVVAVFFTMVLSIHILLGVMRVGNHITDAIAARTYVKFWKRLVLVFVLTAPIIWGYHLFLYPAIKEVIAYYSQD